jgi:hypothetical protein
VRPRLPEDEAAHDCERTNGSLEAMNYKSFLYALLAFIALLGIIRAFRSNGTVKAAEEQAVILKIKLASGQMGTDEERHRIHNLEGQLSDAINRSAVGQFDGDEYGDGYCTIYLYGPSAEALFGSIKPALKGFHGHPGSYALKRYGKPGSKQDRVRLGDE